MQIRQLMTRPLSRTFGPLRKLELIEPGAGFNVTPPPHLGDSKVVPSSPLIDNLQCS
jgi:hypothetical protein